MRGLDYYFRCESLVCDHFLENSHCLENSVARGCVSSMWFVLVVRDSFPTIHIFAGLFLQMTHCTYVRVLCRMCILEDAV